MTPRCFWRTTYPRILSRCRRRPACQRVHAIVVAIADAGKGCPWLWASPNVLPGRPPACLMLPGFAAAQTPTDISRMRAVVVVMCFSDTRVVRLLGRYYHCSLYLATRSTLLRATAMLRIASLVLHGQVAPDSLRPWSRSMGAREAEGAERRPGVQKR